jgi:hypothetical protein
LLLLNKIVRKYTLSQFLFLVETPGKKKKKPYITGSGELKKTITFNTNYKRQFGPITTQGRNNKFQRELKRAI